MLKLSIEGLPLTPLYKSFAVVCGVKENEMFQSDSPESQRGLCTNAAAVADGCHPQGGNAIGSASGWGQMYENRRRRKDETHYG